MKRHDRKASTILAATLFLGGCSGPSATDIWQGTKCGGALVATGMVQIIVPIITLGSGREMIEGALAKADGHMHPKEEALLYKIAARYGLKERQVKLLIDSNEKFQVVVPDNHNDRMNLLYDLVLMVYADDVIDQHEIDFCEQAVNQFGMKKELVRWLLEEFDRGTPPPPDEWEEMKQEAKENFMLS